MSGDILDTPSAGPTAIRGGMLRVGGYLASVALSVGGVTLLIRHLGAHDVGRYTAVLSLVTLVAGVTEAGMTNIGVREYSVLDDTARKRLMRELLGLRLLITCAGTLIAVTFAVVAGYDQTMVLGTAAAAGGVLLTMIQATYGIPLQSRLRLGWVTILELVRQLATVALVLALVVAGVALLPFFVVPAIAAAVALALTIPVVRGSLPFTPAFDRKESARLFRVTLPYAAATAVGVVYVYVTVVLLSLVSTEAEVGYFGAAFRIFVVLGGIPGLLVASAFPVLARAARDDANRLAYGLQRVFDVSLVLGAGVALCTVVGAPFAIDVIAGNGFGPSVEVLRVQAGAVFASYFVATWGFALLSLARYRAILLANALVLALSTLLTLLLAPDHGALGAAVATLVGEGILAAAYGIALMMRQPDLRVKLGVVPKVAAAAGIGSAALFVPGVPNAVTLALAAAAYGLTAVVLRAVPAEVRAAFSAPRAW